jgi:hypothetical protein
MEISQKPRNALALVRATGFFEILTALMSDQRRKAKQPHGAL